MKTAHQPAACPAYRWNRVYEQQVKDVSTGDTDPRHQWSCVWRWPTGLAELCAEGEATSAADGLRLVADHIATDHDQPLIPTRPVR